MNQLASARRIAGRTEQRCRMEYLLCLCLILKALETLQSCSKLALEGESVTGVGGGGKQTQGFLQTGILRRRAAQV